MSSESQPQQPTILLVDDDPDLLRLLSMRLRSEGFQVIAVSSASEALDQLRLQTIHLIVTDLRMDAMDGLELLDVVRERFPGLPVIMISAHGTIPDAVKAAQHGVHGFLTKPIEKPKLMAEIRAALRLSGQKVIGDDLGVEGAGILTRNAGMRDLLSQARQVAQSDVNVLISGESGTGKELLAQAIHSASQVSKGPFIAVNCGALPENLLESELFGHEKGAFTGADRKRIGLFQAAEGGTLFLDEIGDMPFPLQVKLLRVLQERQVRPLGSQRSQPIHVRIVSATHRQLEQTIESGEFREDLYYRLNVVNLTIPSLAERREDIPLLANHFLHQAANRTGRKVTAFAPDAIQRMLAANWPGNIRQLINVVEQSVALTTAPLIPASLVERALRTKENELLSFNEARKRFEREYLIELLTIANGNVMRAARLAKRNRTDFYKLLTKHQLDHRQFQQDLVDPAGQA